jgi:5'-3' exonuclease
MGCLNAYTYSFIPVNMNRLFLLDAYALIYRSFDSLASSLALLASRAAASSRF